MIEMWNRAPPGVFLPTSARAKKGLIMVFAKTLTLLLTSALSIGALPATAASQAPPPYTSQEIAQMDAEMAELGVDESTRDRLLDDLSVGVLWDSMRSEQPVSQIESNTHSAKRTISTYADGSVSATVSQNPRPASSQLRSLPGCTERFSGGVKYATNCEVAFRGVSFSYGFKVNYSYSRTLSSMSAVAGSHHGHVVAGTWGFDGYTKTNRSVRGNFIITFGALLAKTFKIQGNVNSGGAWITRP